MLVHAARILRSSRDLRRRVTAVYAFLLAFNVVAWALTLLASTRFPILLPTAFLAYSFGLRHAVDADHIAAIDNTTRKLMQDGARPVAVGLFFSLGHSTIVVLLSVAIAASAAFVSDVPTLQSIGGLIGTSVSAAFLLLIGLINLVVLMDVYRMFRQVSAGGAYDEQSLDDYLNNRGLLARVFRPALRLIRAQLAHVPARGPVRARVRHGERGGPARARGDLRRQPRPGLATSCCCRWSSPPVCRSSTRRTGC